MTHDHDESAYRNHIREHLYPVLRELEPVRALWEGGSAARGALDEYSDIDICMHAEDEAFARIWEVFEAALSKIAKVEQRWSPGKGLWPGMEQRVYILEDAPPYFMLDVVLFPASQPIPILERERHGEPIVILDRDGEVIPCALDREAHEARMKRACEHAWEASRIYLRLANKEIARGRDIDAHGYYRASLGLLHTMLGATYRPDTFDFGSRYLHEALPEEEAQRLERLTFFKASRFIETLEEMNAWFHKLRDDLLGPPKQSAVLEPEQIANERE